MSRVADDSLARVRELTREMLQAARNGDWERLIELERQRRAPFEAFASDLRGRLPQAPEAALMREMLDTEREVSALVAERRQDLAVGLDSAAARRRLADAYGSD